MQQSLVLCSLSLTLRFPLLTLSATRSHQYTPTHLARITHGQHWGQGTVMSLHFYLWAFSCLSMTSWLLGRAVCNFPSGIKFRIVFTAVNLGWGCWKGEVLAPFSWGFLCLQSYLPVGITPRGVAMGCGNPVIIPLPEYFCLLLTNQLWCDLMCLWAFLTEGIYCTVLDFCGSHH